MLESVAWGVLNAGAHVLPRQDLRRSWDCIRQIQDRGSEGWVPSAQGHRVEAVRTSNIEQRFGVLGQPQPPCEFLGGCGRDIAHAPLVAAPLVRTEGSVQISWGTVAYPGIEALGPAPHNI